MVDQNSLVHKEHNMARKNKVQVNEHATAEDIAKLEEKKARKAARNEVKKAARLRIREYANDLEAGDLKSDLLLIVGGGRTSTKRRGPSRKAVADALRNAFLERESLTEMEIFKEFKLGRPEMLNRIRSFIKVKDAEDRVWITFDEDAETYNLVETGPNPPEGWDGYLPNDEELI
jgi:hypothetical protein